MQPVLVIIESLEKLLIDLGVGTHLNQNAFEFVRQIADVHHPCQTRAALKGMQAAFQIFDGFCVVPVFLPLMQGALDVFQQFAGFFDKKQRWKKSGAPETI